jgi:hypothetical protein
MQHVSPHGDPPPPCEVLLREYEQLKGEQVERIKQRDAFVNLNIVAIGVVAGFLASHSRDSLAWLAVPWIGTAFGWFYVMNDEKVSALQRYFEVELKPRLPPGSLGWETFDRRKTTLRRTHKVGQLILEVTLFVLPTLVSVVAFWTGRGPQPWFASVLGGIEALGGVALGFVIWAASDLSRRFNVGAL